LAGSPFSRSAFVSLPLNKNGRWAGQTNTLEVDEKLAMPQQRDLNRTRERIMAAAQKEFAASGFAGARTDAIARRARVNERMIFYCFDSKEGLYRAVLKHKLSVRAGMIESTPDENLTSNLVNGFAAICADVDALRMWLWEALDKSNRKLVAEEERRAFFQAEVSRWRRAKVRGSLPSDADEQMLLLVSIALRSFPLALPQVTSLVTGTDPLDPEFRKRWSSCLEWIGRRLLAPTLTTGDEHGSEKEDEQTGQNKPRSNTGQLSSDTNRTRKVRSALNSVQSSSATRGVD
jgi:TetR/AcrR family transcriptional regulator